MPPRERLRLATETKFIIAATARRGQNEKGGGVLWVLFLLSLKRLFNLITGVELCCVQFAGMYCCGFEPGVRPVPVNTSFG